MIIKGTKNSILQLSITLYLKRKVTKYIRHLCILCTHQKESTAKFTKLTFIKNKCLIM